MTSPTPWIFVRLVQEFADGYDSHVCEFAGHTLEEAVGRAMDWNADRSHHRTRPSLEGVDLQRWDVARGTWQPLHPS